MEDTHFLIFQLNGVNHIFAFGVFDGHHGKFLQFAKLELYVGTNKLPFVSTNKLFTLHNCCLIMTWIIENLISSSNVLCIYYIVGLKVAKFPTLDIQSFFV
jgi:hypothetical protein